jgi:hypothetical protein
VEEVRALARVADPVVRARESSELLAHYQDAVTELSRIRREAVQDLAAAGLSQAQIAEKIGLSRSRIGQIAKSGPLTERAFLGDGALTVVLGQKKEEGRDEPVIALETTTAFDRFKELARSCQLEASMEPVGPPGIFDLNRDNLVIMAGPRLFPLVGQILASDPHLRFETDPTGVWKLHDLQTGEEFHSPRDAGEPGDFGYLGRLPRPDGRGMFLCIAGLHATGTQGVVAFLETALADVYATVKVGRFSMVIGCEYDPATRTVTSAKQASPIYTRS